MTQFAGKVTELQDEDPYALWDAAYVLGSLSSQERREYEAHLAGCPRCRAAVAELSGMPALLAHLDPKDVEALDAEQPEPPLRPEVLESLLAKVRWRRRRSRMMSSVALAAAAAVLAVALVITVLPGVFRQETETPQATGTELTMNKVAPTPINATVTLHSFGWGTRIDMACSYGDWGNRDAPPQGLGMVVVGRDGSHSEVATWLAMPGATALPSGNTPMPINEIGAVQLVSTDSREVLLEANL
jgi:hypothetical protein